MKEVKHLASRPSGISSTFIDNSERSKYPLFTTERFSFDLCPTIYPLRVFANRYTPHKSCESGFTLVLIHAVGMHKETWEPTVGRLLSPEQPEEHCIHEIYSFEQPNHGESAVYNTKTIQQVYGEEWSLKDCANAFNILFTGHPSSGFAVDFSKRKLVGVGHSMGTVILSLMHAVSTPPPVFHSLIMIEPGMYPRDVLDAQVGTRMLCAWAWTREDTWTSHESARTILSRHKFYAGTWDERVLDLYVQHALTAHPASKFEGAFRFAGVTTAISRAREIACYRNGDFSEAIKAYTSLFSQLAPIRVHIICGTERSVVTPNIRHVLCDTSIGHFPVSIRYIAGAGHLAVQQCPDEVGRTIACVMGEDEQQLRIDEIVQPMRSRL